MLLQPCVYENVCIRYPAASIVQLVGFRTGTLRMTCCQDLCPQVHGVAAASAVPTVTVGTTCIFYPSQAHALLAVAKLQLHDEGTCLAGDLTAQL